MHYIITPDLSLSLSPPLVTTYRRSHHTTLHNQTVYNTTYKQHIVFYKQNIKITCRKLALYPPNIHNIHLTTPQYHLSSPHPPTQHTHPGNYSDHHHHKMTHHHPRCYTPSAFFTCMYTLIIG